MKYCFMKDDDGHTFLVPLKEREKWCRCIDNIYSGTETKEDYEFVDSFRCNSATRFSFEKPEPL